MSRRSSRAERADVALFKHSCVIKDGPTEPDPFSPFDHLSGRRAGAPDLSVRPSVRTSKLCRRSMLRADVVECRERSSKADEGKKKRR